MPLLIKYGKDRLTSWTSPTRNNWLSLDGFDSPKQVEYRLIFSWKSRAIHVGNSAYSNAFGM
jgi:hypothetical protein